MLMYRLDHFTRISHPSGSIWERAWGRTDSLRHITTIYKKTCISISKLNIPRKILGLVLKNML